MKSPHYRIRLSPRAVSVQHRVRRPPGELWVLAPVYGFIIYFNDGFRIMADLVRKSDRTSFCLAFILNVAFVLLFSWSWLIYSTGEFLHCDSTELHTGKRCVWIRWRRGTFKRQAVSKLERQAGQQQDTLVYGADIPETGKRKDILEDLSLEDAVRVLEACNSMGYDCTLPEVFPNHDGPMKADIEQRGWFVNPWRPDSSHDHPTN